MSTRNAGQGKVTFERSYRARLGDIWDLWTTKAGFESWWGPEGFRAEVSEIDAREGGALRYEMIADTAEMIAALKQLGRPPSHPTNARFTEIKLRERLVITNVIDFIPNVASFESDIVVELQPVGDLVRMVVTLDPMHDEETTRMQEQGFTSQLTKLDRRFAS